MHCEFEKCPGVRSLSQCWLILTFTLQVHKDVVIPGEKETTEVKFYVNLRSLCLKEAELDNSIQFIKYRQVGSQYTKTKGSFKQN